VRVFLDYMSATPLLPEVRDAMAPFIAERFGNPSSLHLEGVQAREALARARQQVAALIGAESPESILFTSGGTEAVNLAVKGAALAQKRRGAHIVLSAAEQPAVSRSVDWLADLGFSATRVPVDRAGRVDPAEFAAALRPDTVLACIHHANHDIGTIQPLESIGSATSEKGVPLFVDATASAGWIPLDVQAAPADLVALAPHRFYGPKGVGALYRHRRARLAPLIHGGDQEDGRRAGTENVAAIAGAGAASVIAARDLAARQSAARKLQEMFLSEFSQRTPHAALNGPPPGPERLPHQLSLSIEFVEGEGLALMLDVRGVAIASGAACVTKSMRVPPVLAAIRLPEELAKGTVMVSCGAEQTPGQMVFAAEALAKAVSVLREMSPSWDDFKAGRIPSLLP
jgi:cysteine desulfurase